MADSIKIALLGLGEVGSGFAQHLLEKSQNGQAPVKIAAVADHHTDSPVALGFAQSGVPVFQDALGVADLGEKVDIIFDLTGNPELRRGLRDRLADQGNRHTVIAPETVAKLLWYFFNEEGEMYLHTQSGYS